MPAAAGRGLYASALVERFPALPVEEEGRLNDPAIRENFIERVFAMPRWRAFAARRPRARDLVAFHAALKFAVLAHGPLTMRAWGDWWRPRARSRARCSTSTRAC